MADMFEVAVTVLSLFIFAAALAVFMLHETARNRFWLPCLIAMVLALIVGAEHFWRSLGVHTIFTMQGHG